MTGQKRPSWAGRPSWAQAEADAAPGPAAFARPPAVPMPAHGGIFKSAAVEVLRRTRRFMPTGEICRLALDWGLLTCSGKTPEATMASAMYGDVKRRDRLSLFIRPQEGMFGLREWVDLGLLPGWQECLAPAPALAPMQACAQPPPTVTPAKRSAPAGHGHAASGSGVPRGPGRPKKARHSGSDSEDDEWSSSDTAHSKSERQGASDDEHLEPKQYDLRKGQVGRLQEAAAQCRHRAPAAAVCLAQCQLASLEPFDLPNLRQRSDEAGVPPTASGQRRCSGSGSASSLLSPPLYTVLQSPQAAVPALPARHSGVCGALLSPSAALGDWRSPPSASLAFMGSTPASLAGLLAPRSRVHSTGEQQRPVSCGSSQQRHAALALKGAAAAAAAAGAAVPAVPGASAAMVPVCGGDPVGAPCLGLGLDLLPILPLDLQHPRELDLASLAAGSLCVAGLLPTPAPEQAAAGQAQAGASGQPSAYDAGLGIPEVIFRLPPPRAGSPSAAACGADGYQPDIALLSGGRWPVMPTGLLSLAEWRDAPSSGCAEQAAGCHAPPAAVRGSRPADGGGGSSAKPSASQGRGSFTPAAAAADGAGGGAGGGSSAAAIAQKIQEVEGKVGAVEARWGPLSLKTAKAYWLLHHACRHPQAAALCCGRADEALQRAAAILQHASQARLAAGELKEYRGLLEGIRAAGGGNAQRS